jgi:hypothetical protein
MPSKKASLLSRTFARVAGALARFLAEPVSRPVATRDVLALSGLLCAGDVLLTEGNTRAEALVRRVTRSPWSHVSIYVGPLEAGDDPPCMSKRTSAPAFARCRCRNSRDNGRGLCVP